MQAVGLTAVCPAHVMLSDCQSDCRKPAERWIYGICSIGGPT